MTRTARTGISKLLALAGLMASALVVLAITLS
jgi:hypothetical protein